MKIMKKVTAILILMAGLTLSAGAESLSLEEIILMARENNASLMGVLNTLKSAENDLTGDLRLGNSSLTASGDWSADDNSDGNPSGSLSVNVPVIDQLSLKSSLSSDQDVSASVSISPFNMTSTKAGSEAAYDNARSSLLYTEGALDWEILDQALALALAGKTYDLARELEQLENDQYEASYALYLAGDITYDDLLDAMDELTTAEDNSLSSEDTLLSARQDILASIGEKGDFAMEELSMDDAASLIKRLKAELGTLQTDSVSSLAVTQARNALVLAEREEDITLAFQPDLSFSAGVSGNLEDPSGTAGVLSVSLTLSGGSFNSTEKDILSSEVRQKETELNQALLESELEKESLISAMERAAKATEAAERDLERYRILADETSLLYERGERTILEKTEADLQLTDAQNTLFERYIGEISATAGYLGLFPENGPDLLEILS